MGKNDIKTDKEGIGDGKNKKNWWGGVEKIKNLLGGSLSCAVPGKKGGGYMPPRRPFVNVTNVTQRNEYILYTIYKTVLFILYIIYPA